jgi:hypothetical protein
MIYFYKLYYRNNYKRDIIIIILKDIYIYIYIYIYNEWIYLYMDIFCLLFCYLDCISL